uniref:(northern house mosquito) hypothetical protein n=1 Tax=Culex pipiens TaxID=7175 RepID=A0A8D8AQ27_CULPI
MPSCCSFTLRRFSLVVCASLKFCNARRSSFSMESRVRWGNLSQVVATRISIRFMLHAGSGGGASGLLLWGGLPVQVCLEQFSNRFAMFRRRKSYRLVVGPSEKSVMTSSRMSSSVWMSSSRRYR